MSFFFLEFRRRLLLLQKTHFAFFSVLALGFSLSLSLSRARACFLSLQASQKWKALPRARSHNTGAVEAAKGVAAEEEAAEWEVQRGIRLASKIHASVAGEEAANQQHALNSNKRARRNFRGECVWKEAEKREAKGRQ